MGSKSALSSHRLRTTMWLALLLFVWFLSSIVAALINKMLMIHFPYPVTISAVHMLSSVVVDFFIVVSRGLSLQPFRWDVFWQCLPVALTINFGKTLTYVSSSRIAHSPPTCPLLQPNPYLPLSAPLEPSFSYGMVPASLTHTAKVSSIALP